VNRFIIVQREYHNCTESLMNLLRSSFESIYIHLLIDL